MLNARLGYSERNEHATRDAMTALGFTVGPYGQGQHSEQVRRMLADQLTELRWTADFLVSPPLLATIGKQTFLVDAKFSFENQPPNVALEMRSVLTAEVERLETFYVASIKRTGGFSDFGVISACDVYSLARDGCCEACWCTYMGDRDPMRSLPIYCPNRQRTQKASSTPFVLCARQYMVPLSRTAFDLQTRKAS